MSDDWYEIWVDDSGDAPYPLLVRQRAEAIEVFDFKERKVVRVGPSYEEIRLWLLEDEFERVEGRMQEDSYWEK